MRPILKAPKEEKERKVSFTGKEDIQCPACEAKFRREELFSQRVNAGDLTDELHRLYIPMQAWGEVQPLVYDITVCPACWYAAWKQDFPAAPPKTRKTIAGATAARLESAQRLFAPLDFGGPRGILEGAASYWLAMLCYDHFPAECAPTIKQGISSLRAAWLCSRLEEQRPGEGFEWAAGLLYRKARFLYRRAVELEQSGEERIGECKWLGPDTDKNYGYEGVLYLQGVLEWKYGPREDDARRTELVAASKMAIAKLFGLGKRSRSKPGPLLDKARDFYDRLKAELSQDDDEADDGEA